VEIVSFLIADSHLWLRMIGLLSWNLQLVQFFIDITNNILVVQFRGDGLFTECGIGGCKISA